MYPAQVGTWGSITGLTVYPQHGGSSAGVFWDRQRRVDLAKVVAWLCPVDRAVPVLSA